MTNDQVKERLKAKDTQNTGQLEQRLAAKKAQEKEEGDGVVDEEGARQVLRKSWLGQEIQQREVKKYSCKNCSKSYQSVKPPEKCPNCGNQGFENTGVVDEIEAWVQVTDNPKMNREGFASLWGTILPYLTRAAQMTYVKPDNIAKMVLDTVRAVQREILDNMFEYDIDPANAPQITNETFVLIYSAASKSRDGRSMVNKERTLVEKISRMASDDEDEGVLGVKNLL